MPFFYEPSHYHAIRQILTAADVGARVVSNDKAMSIEVKLEDGEVVLWNNSANTWAFSVVNEDGAVAVGEADMDSGAPPEEVARYIAEYPYQAALVAASSDV